MNDLELTIQNAIDRYFNILFNTGYIKDNNLQSLLILIGIHFTLKNFGVYITDEDMLNINKVLNNIEGTCLIDYIANCGNDTLGLKEFLRTYRITDNNILRITEDSILRTIE